MIVKLKENLTQQELEVLITYASMTSTVKKLESLIKSVDKHLKCFLDVTEVWVNVSDIYYIESVDKRTFVYCQNEVYRTNLRLYQLVEELSTMGFVQINKACILNINTLTSIKSLFNSRLEATLCNGEHLTITRKYIPSIRQLLEGSVTNEA